MKKRILAHYQRWRRFWFEPATPFNLGFCRMLFYGSVFLFYMETDLSAWADVDTIFLKPIWLFSLLHLPVLSENHIVIIQLVWKAALGLSCIGLFTRLSTFTSFVLGIYLLGLPHNFGKTNHSDAILVFILGIMALSHCGDGLSVDRWLSRLRQKGGQALNHPKISGEYTWPVRVVWLLMALIFFGAGVSKIRHSGLEWIMSDNLSILLIQSNAQGSSLVSWGTYIAQISWLSRMISAGTLVFEVGFPLALFSRRARWIIAPVTFLIQIGIRILMGIDFRQFMIGYVFWVPWNSADLIVRSVGVIGIILLSRPDWGNRLARMAGIGHDVELFIYLGLTAFAFLFLIYYAVRGAWKSRTPA